MNFKGFIDTSFVDWDGKICAVVFTPGCNFRCPFCFNRDLVLKPEIFDDVPEEFVLDFLQKNRDFHDGVCITGGEPTIMVELAGFCQRVKAKGFLVKLDTNGSQPNVLRELLNKKLLDFIAMDIKGPWEDYAQFAGVTRDIENVKESANLIMNSDIGYEFRTTLVPSLHTKAVFEKTVAQVKGAKKYCIQKFQPGLCIDPAFNREKHQTDAEMAEYAKITAKYVKNVKIRGK